MKKIISVTMLVIVLFCMSACAGNGNTSTTKQWTKSDIEEMFNKVKKIDEKFVQCLLIPDYASKRVGAVLYLDEKEGAVNVSWFDEEGCFQTCGVHSTLSSEPDFTYLGDGKVSFKMVNDAGKEYTYFLTLTINEDGDKVHFLAEEEGNN